VFGGRGEGGVSKKPDADGEGWWWAVLVSGEGEAGGEAVVAGVAGDELVETIRVWMGFGRVGGAGA